MMPQWHFLDFVAREAAHLPSFTLRMKVAATRLAEARGRVTGVVTADGDTIPARLVIAADGRGSTLRRAAQLPLRDLGAPIDVFWFRVPKQQTPDNRTQAYVTPGEMFVTIDRGDYFQCARVIKKGDAETIRAAGLDRFRSDVAAAVPPISERIGAIAGWADVKLLEVSLDRLTRWHRPGLLAIGDAAHAMSPVGGVGINLAIQDAVAAANILARPLAAGEEIDPLLARVQQRRMLPVQVVQGMQRAIHARVIGAAMRNTEVRAPALLRLLDAVPLLQRIPARILGLGVRREHIRSPKAPIA